MKCKVLASFLLGFLLAMNNALDHLSSATVILGQEENKNEVEVTRNYALYVEKEHFAGSEAVHMRKLRLGRKKLMMAHKESSMGLEDENGKDGGTSSKISGTDKDDLNKSLESFQGQISHQKKQTTVQLEPKASELFNFVSPRNSQDSSSLKRSFLRTDQRRIFEKTHGHGSTEKDESQRLQEAAKEIVNLMDKDYRGMARRKPPIHNEEPRN